MLAISLGHFVSEYQLLTFKASYSLVSVIWFNHKTGSFVIAILLVY